MDACLENQLRALSGTLKVLGASQLHSMDLLGEAKAPAPDVVILNLSEDLGEKQRLLQQAIAKIHQTWPDVAILVISLWAPVLCQRILEWGAHHVLVPAPQWQSTPLAMILRCTMTQAQNQRALSSQCDQLQDQLQQQQQWGQLDSATGLLNRQGLQRQLRSLQHIINTAPTQASLALVYLDVDAFSQIQDQTKALQRCTQRLQQHFPDAAIARVGTDEFAMLLPVTLSPTATLALLNKHLGSGFIDRSISSSGLESEALRWSIGVAFDAGVSSWRRLMNRADAAMQRAKRRPQDGRICCLDECAKTPTLHGMMALSESREYFSGQQLRAI